MEKKYDPLLVARVSDIREGIEVQPLAQLMAVVPSLREKAGRLRRILCGKVYKGDEYLILEMEQAKEKLLRARG